MSTTTYNPTLREKYQNDVVPALRNQLGYNNIMEVPFIKKVILNQGVGAAVADKKLIDKAVEELSLIAGQKAVPTYARNSVSSFKLREGMPIGAKVTLRRARMYEFIERLISVALPRVRDFQGISDKGFDGGGNYTLGVNEQIIFPEINMDSVQRINGMDITFVTSAPTDREAYLLLKEIGLPFRNANEK